MSRTPEQAIDLIIASFDWEKVRRTMLALDWRWGSDREGREFTPTIGQLQRAARDKLHYVAAPDSTGYCSGGGLTARRNEDGFLSLTFEVAHAGCHTGEEKPLPPL